MKMIGMQLTDSNSLRAIVAFCSANYNKELSLSMLEEHLHLNRYYISHLFNDKLGLRFNDYINAMRLSEACRRLIHSDDTITSISDQVGFATLRTFNRAFVKRLGISPSEYRRNNSRRETE
jgi:xylan 1,4-beta-xylosidase